MAAYTVARSSFLGFCLVLTTINAVPVSKSGPGIEILPAAQSENGQLNYVVVDDNEDAYNNVQAPQPQPQYSTIRYQQPATSAPQLQFAQQPQIQYQQSFIQQPQYQYYQQPYYQPSFQQPGYSTYQQPAYYGGSSQSYGPYYAQGLPVQERAGFTNRYSDPISSLFGSSLSSSTSAFGRTLGRAASLLFG